EQTLRYSLQALGLVPLFVWAIRHPNSLVGRVLNSRVMHLFGVLSYTLYLVHTTVLFAVNEWLPWSTAARGCVALGISLVVALAVHHWVERPCGELRRRLSRIGTSHVPGGSQPAVFAVPGPG